ncbi:fat storage-inducing transmembrane protein 2 [Rhizophlyctis rosea]|uniref:Fat storage-inducing transmembrane protein 2 n=1 Tax=Rhizophlyctis rosea TaxID=64517 RepID=A0AAD5SGG2_9FUNG|nr:fat storage-inducing transmembrane protein 2 [Rhizophlyctis rosea]
MTIPSRYQRALAIVYAGTVILGTAVQELFAELPVSVFNNKRNPLNIYFVKLGWAWTALPLLILMPMAAWHASAGKSEPIRKKAVTHAVLRFLGATLYWIFLAQWFFGDAILERIYINTGSCSLGVEHALPRLCKKNGGNWLGFDISGHCFLLIHASLFIFEELRVISQKRSTTSRAAQSQAPSEAYQVTEAVLSSLLVALLLLWWVMLIATSLYFHSWREKIVGTVVGMSYWAAVYVVGLPLLAPQALPTGLGVAKLDDKALGKSS